MLDNIDVGLKAVGGSPKLEEGDTLESTPTPSMQAAHAAKEAVEPNNVDNVLD